jgi:hypothetical protein
MRYLFTIIILLSVLCGASQRVQVVVPAQPVNRGVAFQVQYVLYAAEEWNVVATPLFDSCRVVSGPHFYKGTTLQNGVSMPVQNVTYTLVPLRTGTLRIGPLRLRSKASQVESPAAVVNVTEPARASYKTQSSYTDVNLYAPRDAAQLEQLIAENLFIKTIVSRKVCLVGQPIVATYKLYSRLQSASEALNAPSFYGFSAMDMLPVNESHTGVEVIDGKVFNTAILRKVQLYPAQAGQLTIDAMQIENEIEFDDTIRHQKVKLKRQMTSQPVVVTVNDLPPPPDDFTGAVGKFAIRMQVEKAAVLTDETTRVQVALQGAGNFIQIASPSVAWPAGLELLDQRTEEAINRNETPVQGRKVYSFDVTASSAGSYEVPPIQLTYFDTQLRKYVRLQTNPIAIQVQKGSVKKKKTTEPQSESHSPVPYLILPGLLLVALLRWIWKKRNNQVVIEKPQAPVQQQTTREKLAALQQASLTEAERCREISRLLHQHLHEKGKNLSTAHQQEIRDVIAQCNEVLYRPVAKEKLSDQITEQALRAVREV